jgi:hypothetical protein
MPRKRVSAREVKHLSLVGGKAGRFHADHTDWNFTNLVTPYTEERPIEQIYDELFDTKSIASDSTEESSSQDDDSSSYTNEDYYDYYDEDSDDEFSNCPETDNDVSNNRDAGSGNRLLNITQLNTLLTSTACCKHCTMSSWWNAMDSFVQFCELETEKIVNTCRSVSCHDRNHFMNNSISTFYEKWKKTPGNTISTLPLQFGATTYGIA